MDKVRYELKVFKLPQKNEPEKLVETHFLSNTWECLVYFLGKYDSACYHYKIQKVG